MMAFWAHTHVGVNWDFVGESWEDGGFRVDEDGNPTHDPNRNTVAGFTVEELTGDDARPMTDANAARIYSAYAGDDLADAAEFRTWLETEGFGAEDRTFIINACEDDLTECCASCDAVIPFQNPDRADVKVPAVDDDEVWRELEAKHDEDCEWVLTRAHRLDLPV